ncbi:tetraspanin-8-like [Salvia divinorum]|uniref:Tetraspanin-8-like n=1 Tax=Salvia divinorum TaxID=28513 RepID=A0ABD1IF10_SALDI
MVRASNGMIIALNVATMAVALSAMGFSLWFHVRDGSQCQRILKTPLLVVGVALLVVAAAGLVGAITGSSPVMWAYLFMLLGLIVSLVVFTIFTVMVTNRGVGRAVSGQGVGDHRLGNYSKWLQRYVVNARNWDEIKSCMIDAGVCKLAANVKTGDIYNPIVSGCCKPPGYCGMERRNASYWVMPKKRGAAASEPDCKAWSNKAEEMCYGCDACKKAVLRNIRREWKMVALINMGIIVVVTVVYSIGCCALRNNRFHYHIKSSHPHA